MEQTNQKQADGQANNPIILLMIDNEERRVRHRREGLVIPLQSLQRGIAIRNLALAFPELLMPTPVFMSAASFTHALVPVSIYYSL